MKKVFVSSTFKDFNAERDAIRNIVTPKLNAIAREYAESVTFCDLRWGVDTTELETDDGARKVLSVCLNEIDNSKPYIIVLIGDRYGWLPNQNFIYDAAKQKKFNVNSNEKISVTELEIQYGALPNLNNAIFYFRNIVGDIPVQYHDDYLNDENADKLQHLKNFIDQLGNKALIRHYNLSWSDATKSLSVGLDRFCNMVEQDIETLMNQEWQKRKYWSVYELDQHLQWDFAKQKAIQYVDHDNLLKRCIKELHHPIMILRQNTTEKSQQGLLAIKGKSGSGKTTLLSQLALTLKNQGFDVLVIFCGLTSNVCTARDILRYMIYFIEIELNLPHFYASGKSTLKTSSEYIHMLSMLINVWKQKTNKKLIFILDAIDQLIEDRELENLIFIPSKDLSGQIKMIFSYSDEFKISRYFNTVLVEELKHRNKTLVIEGITQYFGKCISQYVINEISAMKSFGNPLYLSLLIQRLEMMRQTDFEKINALSVELKKIGDKNPGMSAINQIQSDIIRSCSSDLEEFCRELVNFSARNFGEFVKLAVEYIAVSRYGLREEDLSAILIAQGVKWNALNFSMFMNYLNNFFIQRTDGRIDFAHKIIRQSIEKNISEIKEYHKRILAYLKTLDFNAPLCRQELVFHCIKADDKKFFVGYIYKLHNYNHYEIMVDVHAKNGIIDDVAVDKYNIFRTFRSLMLNDGGSWFSMLVQEIKNAPFLFSEKEIFALLIFSNNSRIGMIGGEYKPRYFVADEKLILANIELAAMLIEYNDSNENQLQFAIQLITHSSLFYLNPASTKEIEKALGMAEEAVKIYNSIIENDIVLDSIMIETFTDFLNNLNQICYVGTMKNDALRRKAEIIMKKSITYAKKILYSNPETRNVAALSECIFTLGKLKCSALFPKNTMYYSAENLEDNLSDVMEGITLCEQSISMLEKIVVRDTYFKVENNHLSRKDDQKLRCFSPSRGLIIPDLIGNYNVLAFIYKSDTKVKNLNKALEYTQKALKWSGVIRDVTPSYHADSLFATALENCADIHMQLAFQNYPSIAASHITEAIKVRTFWINLNAQNEAGDLRALMNDFKHMGLIYAHYKNYSAAQLNFENAISFAKAINDKKEIINLCDLVIAVCEGHHRVIATRKGEKFVIPDYNGQTIELNHLELNKLIEEERKKATSRKITKKLRKIIQKYAALKESVLEEINEPRILITRNDNHHIADQYYAKISREQLLAIDEYLQSFFTQNY